MSQQEQESQFLFTQSEPTTPNTSPPDSPINNSLMIDVGETSSAGSSSSLLKRSNSQPQAEEERIKPIILKRQSLEEAVIIAKKKRMTAGEKKRAEIEEINRDGLWKAMLQQPANWINASNPMQATTPLSVIPPPPPRSIFGVHEQTSAAGIRQPAMIPYRNPIGPMVSATNWQKKTLAILQVAARFGHMGANSMIPKVNNLDVTREEMIFFSDLCSHVEIMLSMFKN